MLGRQAAQKERFWRYDSWDPSNSVSCEITPCAPAVVSALDGAVCGLWAAFICILRNDAFAFTITSRRFLGGGACRLFRVHGAFLAGGAGIYWRLDIGAN